MAAAWLAAVLSAALLAAPATAQAPAGAAAPLTARGPRAALAQPAHTVSYDHYSLLIDGRRLYL